MATDRIRELAVEVLKNCSAHYANPQWYNDARPQMIIDRAVDNAEAMLRAALADKTLIDGELREQLNSKVKVSDELQEMASKYQADLEAAEGELAAARQNEIWGFYENEAPIYTTRENAHELSQLMTVEEANGLVTKLMATRQDSERLKHLHLHFKEFREFDGRFYNNHESCSYESLGEAIDAALEAQREKAKRETSTVSSAQGIPPKCKK